MDCHESGKCWQDRESSERIRLRYTRFNARIVFAERQNGSAGIAANAYRGVKSGQVAIGTGSHFLVYQVVTKQFEYSKATVYAQNKDN